MKTPKFPPLDRVYNNLLDAFRGLPVRSKLLERELVEDLATLHETSQQTRLIFEGNTIPPSIDADVVREHLLNIEWSFCVLQELMEERMEEESASTNKH